MLYSHSALAPQYLVSTHHVAAFTEAPREFQRAGYDIYDEYAILVQNPRTGQSHSLRFWHPQGMEEPDPLKALSVILVLARHPAGIRVNDPFDTDRYNPLFNNLLLLSGVVGEEAVIKSALDPVRWVQQNFRAVKA